MWQWIRQTSDLVDLGFTGVNINNFECVIRPYAADGTLKTKELIR